MIRILEFISYFAMWVALVAAGAILAGCADECPTCAQTPAERPVMAIEMQYYGYDDPGTDPQKESPTANVYDDLGDLVTILFNRDTYDTVMVPACSLTVEFVDNYEMRSIVFWPVAGARYLVRHPIIEVKLP